MLDSTISFKQIQRPGVDAFVFDLHRSEPITTTNLLQWILKKLSSFLRPLGVKERTERTHAEAWKVDV